MPNAVQKILNENQCGSFQNSGKAMQQIVVYDHRSYKPKHSRVHPTPNSDFYREQQQNNSMLISQNLFKQVIILSLIDPLTKVVQSLIAGDYSIDPTENLVTIFRTMIVTFGTTLLFKSRNK